MSKESIGFELVPLPSWLRTATKVADVLDGTRPSFHHESLLAAAGRSAGLLPEFPAHVHEAFEVLCKALNEETHLHALGVANNESLIVTGLAEMLRIEKIFADNPSLARTPLRSPVVVMGLPRSGTTFLHRLLSAAPDAVGVPLYRHLFPTRPTPIDYRFLKARVLFAPWLAASRVYNLDAIHYVRPELPDECNFGMRLSGRSMIYFATNPVHTYLRWVLAQDLRETYQLYRKVLILHQLANPNKRLTLKCPQHSAWLPALTEALPEATIVQTHRNPMEIIPSESKLILSLHGISVRELDWKKSVESNYFKILTYAQRTAAFADTDAGRRVVHVDYRNIVRDPVGVAVDIHQRAELPLSDQHRTSLAKFAAANRQHKHGKNVYSLEDYGLDAAKIANDFAVYRERFIPAKPE